MNLEIEVESKNGEIGLIESYDGGLPLVNWGGYTEECPLTDLALTTTAEVFDGESCMMLDGIPTLRLALESAIDDCGKVSAYLDNGTWHYVPPGQEKIRWLQGHTVRTVWVEIA